MKKTGLTWNEIGVRAEMVARKIGEDFPQPRVISVYPIPRGGVYAAQAVKATRGTSGEICLELTERPEEASLYIDDIIDSGETLSKHSDKPFYALVDKREEDLGWVVFPWERMNGEGAGPEENIRRLIEYIGDDPNREGLVETPSRVLRSYSELFGGYGKNVEEVFKTFEDERCDEMVVVKDIEFFSTCEHHMLPFFGKAHIGYVPNGRVIGVSKLVRLLEVFCRRLQIQERLCEQVTSVLNKHLNPKGSACVLEARHLCMTGRGVGKQGSVMVTSSLTGVFREQGNLARQEFLSVIR